MAREKLAARRQSEVYDFIHDGFRYIGSVSRFADGRIAEVFIDVGKPGDQVDIMAKDMAVVTSLALQHGVPVATLMDALSQERDGTMRGPLGMLLAIAERPSGEDGEAVPVAEPKPLAPVAGAAELVP